MAGPLLRRVEFDSNAIALNQPLIVVERTRKSSAENEPLENVSSRSDLTEITPTPDKIDKKVRNISWSGDPDEAFERRYTADDE